MKTVNLLAITALVLSGFIFPLSLTISLVFTPLLMLGLLGIQAFLEKSSTAGKHTANMHYFPRCWIKSLSSHKKAV